MLHATRRSRAASERGGALFLMVAIIGVALFGVTVVMTEEYRGEVTDVGRSEGQIRALEIAEVGLSRAAMEIAALHDSAADGIGFVSGSYAGGTYAVTATNSGTDWTLISIGTFTKASRRIEQGVRRVAPSPFGAAILSVGAINVSGGTFTDSYDSRLGTYASQATHSDASGSYALASGAMGSNAGITLSGGARVRGDAIPGTGHTDSISGGAVVTGSTVARTSAMSLPATPNADFTAAYTTNNNGSWTVGSGSVTYNAATKAFSASGGATVTFPAGTYFFSTFTISGGATVTFTGATKMYIVASINTSGGSMTNATGSPSNLLVYLHNYVYSGVTTASPPTATISGGTGSALALYGPAATVNISGGSGVYGSFVGNTVTVSGGTAIHYDVALGSGASTTAQLQQTYWREKTPPIE